MSLVRRGSISTTRSIPAGLTQREMEVVVLVAEGLRKPETPSGCISRQRP